MYAAERSLTALAENQDANSDFKFTAMLMAHACELACMRDVVHAGLQEGDEKTAKHSFISGTALVQSRVME